MKRWFECFLFTGPLGVSVALILLMLTIVGVVISLIVEAAGVMAR